MRARAAEQRKPVPKTKRTVEREEQRAVTRVSQPKAAVAPPAPPAEDVAAAVPPPLLMPTPSFVRCQIAAPDGSVRPGWEMWIGEHCFGRADSKELLLASFQRLQSPPESFHWREVRNRMQMRGRPRAEQPEHDRDESWEWDKKETPEPLLLGEEEAEGFQELTWDTQA